MLVVPGTHLFDDYVAETRSARWALLAWVAIARALGTRIALVSIGAGPFADWTSRGRRIYCALGRVALVSRPHVEGPHGGDRTGCPP